MKVRGFSIIQSGYLKMSLIHLCLTYRNTKQKALNFDALADERKNLLLNRRFSLRFFLTPDYFLLNI